MHQTGEPRPDGGGVSCKEVEQEISRLATGATPPIARMPRPTDPDYTTRMREAYTSTYINVAVIAKDPGTIDAGMRIGTAKKANITCTS